MADKELFGNSEQLDDTISRRAAIDALMAILDRPNHAEFLYTDEICKALGQLPSAQQERKNGKWIYNSPVTMKCNQCGFIIKDWDWHRFKYCPNCIADMRGENGG